MRPLKEKVYAAAGYNTVYMGPGRSEFDPSKPMRPFNEYLKEAAEGSLAQVATPDVDEGIIGSFMASRFIKQGHLAGFLPYMTPYLLHKPCVAVEGACGTGGRAVAQALRSVLSGFSNTVLVTGFEIQNSMKSVYGADVLAGASYYQKERKTGHAFFFPGIFSDRAGAYYEKYGYENTRKAMAFWHEQMILNARKCPKAQEYENKTADLFKQGLTPPDPARFVPHLNHTDCSKVTDGASSLLILNEAGLKKNGIEKKQAVEIVSIGEAEGDITRAPEDLNILSTTAVAVKKALSAANLTLSDIGLLELHDCFTITAILALESIGFAPNGKGAEFILEKNTAPDGKIPTNLSGGLGGFGHPTGATGVRQLVDLLHQFTAKASNQALPRTPYGLMISMGGNDKTVTAIVVKKPD